MDLDLLIPDWNKSISQGGIHFYKNIVNTENLEWQRIHSLIKYYDIDMDMPMKDIPKKKLNYLLYGSDVPIAYKLESRSGNTSTKLEYIEGKYLNITNDKYHEDNERQLCLMKTTQGFEIIFVQIAGMVARRIVCNLKEGQEVKAGERYGCIKFGSRVDLYLPKDVEIKVKVGQTMIAGETVIGLVKTK